MKTITNYLFRLIIVFCFFSNSVFAQELLFESPENLGLSPERIDKIENVMNELIDEGVISGAVTLVARHDKVGYLKAFGTKGAETEEKMAIDQLFRICPIKMQGLGLLTEIGRSPKFLL